MQKQLKETQAREKALLEELDAMRQASKTAPAMAGNGITNGDPRHCPRLLVKYPLATAIDIVGLQISFPRPAALP